MNHPYEQSEAVAPVDASTKIRPGAVARDVVIVWVLTAIGGFIVGLSGASSSSDRYIFAIAASNLLLGTIGFTVAGCLTPANRWSHLSWVALFTWLSSIFNVLFLGFSFGNWVASLTFIALMAGVGGAISLLFKKTPGTSA